MAKEKASVVFYELLHDWRMAQAAVIQEFGNGEKEEYEELNMMEMEYKERFTEALVE